jgi:hypothetical protein
MKIDGNELVTMAPYMVTVGNSFKVEGRMNLLEYDIIYKMEKGAACSRSLQSR